MQCTGGRGIGGAALEGESGASSWSRSKRDSRSAEKQRQQRRSDSGSKGGGGEPGNRQGAPFAVWSDGGQQSSGRADGEPEPWDPALRTCPPSASAAAGWPPGRPSSSACAAAACGSSAPPIAAVGGGGRAGGVAVHTMQCEEGLPRASRARSRPPAVLLPLACMLRGLMSPFRFLGSFMLFIAVDMVCVCVCGGGGCGRSQRVCIWDGRVVWCVCARVVGTAGKGGSAAGVVARGTPQLQAAPAPAHLGQPLILLQQLQHLSRVAPTTPAPAQHAAEGGMEGWGAQGTRLGPRWGWRLNAARPTSQATHPPRGFTEHLGAAAVQLLVGHAARRGVQDRRQSKQCSHDNFATRATGGMAGRAGRQ